MAEELADALKARLAQVVSQSLSQFAQHLALVVQANPQGDVAQILTRPDLTQSLASVLASAQQHVAQAVHTAWMDGGGDLASPVYEALQQDVVRAYAEAPEDITRAVTAAYNSVPDEPFVVGVSPPGTNPGAEAAVRRAQAVRDAISGRAQALSLRNGLSVGVAHGESRVDAFLTSAAQQEQDSGVKLGKRWVASMEGRNPRSCAWCKWLHGKVVPLGREFPHPPVLGGHKPPRIYLGRLFGPLLHPNCMCRLETVALGNERPAPEPAAAPAPVPEGFVSSEDIAALPEDRYQRLVHFLSSALHELAQMIRTIVGL